MRNAEDGFANSMFVVVREVMLISAAAPALAQEPVTAESGQAGTTLTAEKTAAVFWERYIEYDWTLVKSVAPTEIEIPSGGSGSVSTR